MKDTCKQTSQHRTAPRVELICTGGDQPKLRIRIFQHIVQLLQTMNITVELPITVYVDNIGAIWLSNNRNTGDRTKHIDIRTAFVKEYQEDGKIIIKFVKSEENDADIFTKNTSSIIYQKHQEKLVWDKKEVNDDQ